MSLNKKGLNQLLDLYENYYVVRSRQHSLESIDLFYYIALKVDSKQRSKGMIEYKISPLTWHEDNQERFPLFCQVLSGGELVTCYKKEIFYCECGIKLDECDDCGGLICPVCDKGEHDEEQDEV